MNVITYVQNKDQLLTCRDLGITEIILEHIDLARFGKLSTDEFNILAQKANELGLKVACEWDILMTEDEFSKKTQVLSELKYYAQIRVQDTGAINYSLTHLDCPMTLILETGNHNLKAIETWVIAIGKRLKKIVLSIELSKEVLEQYCRKLSCPVEFSGVGRILLFYTPRNLLSALTPEVDEQRKKLMTTAAFIEADGESEESPHKGFPIVENRHGTFMFHIKRLFLLDHVHELEQMPITDLRLDLRFDDDFDLQAMVNVIDGKGDGKVYRKDYPYDVIKGYYNINKTDVLFKKLKNYRIQRKDDSYIGEVLEASKGNYLAISIKKHDIKPGDQLKFITPEGKELFCKVHFLKNAKFEDIKVGNKDQLCLIQYFGGVWVKSQVYLDS